MKNAPFRHAVESGLFGLLRGLVRVMPHAASRSTGQALGRVGYRLMRSRRQIALDNLAQALPELEPAEHERIAQGAFSSMTSHGTEMISWQRFDARQLCRRVSLEGWEHVTSGRNQAGSSFIMVSHFGPWEIFGQIAGLYLAPASALVRPLDNPRLDRTLAGMRTRFGLRLIHKHGAARRLVRGIEAGERQLVLIDQRVRPREAIPIPFFGRPAQTPSLIARLAVRHSVPVVPVFAYPAPKGCYRIVARPPIRPSEGADAVVDFTTRCTAAVEREIRRRPDLWLWMHDRWRQA